MIYKFTKSTFQSWSTEISYKVHILKMQYITESQQKNYSDREVSEVIKGL